MRRTSIIALALLAATRAQAEDPAIAAHEVVRRALLERGTAPAERPAMAEEALGAARHEHARTRHEEVERAAHERAATHGARHSREIRPEHGTAAGPHGPMHGQGGAMDAGADCHDAVRNQRTRGMHDGRMPGGMGMGP